MESYNSASFARKLVVGIATAIAVLGYAYQLGAEAKCGDHKPFVSDPCPYSYPCIDEVINALLFATPNKEGFLDSKTYPYQAYGAFTGSASCTPTTDSQGCQACLYTAQSFLDSCKPKDRGSVTVNAGEHNYTMWYAQILER